MKPNLETPLLFPRQTDNRIISTIWTLTLHRIKKKDIGDYTCVVETDKGTFRSKSATLSNIKNVSTCLHGHLLTKCVQIQIPLKFLTNIPF